VAQISETLLIDPPVQRLTTRHAELPASRWPAPCIVPTRAESIHRQTDFGTGTSG
jgi:hypothetical protein